MATRGSLRSETSATHAALRGEVLHVATYAVDAAEDEDVTPPPSPQSAAMLAAFGLGTAEEEEEEEEKQEGGKMVKRKAKSEMEEGSSDSDFLPGEKATAKRKKRRLRQGTSPAASRQRRVETEEAEQEEEEEEEEDQVEVETHKFKTDKRGREKQNWVDDGCAATFETRLAELRRSIELSVRDGSVTFYNNPKPEDDDDGEEEEVELDDGGFHDDDEAVEPPLKPVFYGPNDVMVTDSGLSVPTYVYEHLYPHQKECLDWLHHLHERNTGGILGDEMGLGKTVQIASFLGAMYDAKRVRTVLLLCPASVLLQWVREFHRWYPWLRVVLLHASGTGGTRAGRSYAQLIDEVMAFSTLVNDDDLDGDQLRRSIRGRGDGGIVISTYENVRQYQELFIDLEWDYVVLDEGHRIRNPDAEITLVCKQLKTVHRIILTGTPIQNRLRELWSLFDFVFPGKLGTLPTFEDEFVLPIRTGGYANASKMQVVMAYKCAVALKDIINPFMLRRTKKEIQHVTKMPEKMEQIIFCSLTSRQYEAYESYLSSPEVAAVLKQDVRPFRAISILRHICNHPDLLLTVGESSKASKSRGGRGAWGEDRYGSDLTKYAKRPPGVDYGDPDGSGKMVVLQKILTMWKQQGHRVLLFTQTRKMLDILESYMGSMGYVYCRLDGTTSVKERQSLLDAFNQEGSEIFIFLLTTRAGGIGVNLTGADRVVIFDPDWNPSTDLQARERSWRLGQTKQVTIYRLITSGTIEEKIYHRQIFKQYLTNKVLSDAKRKRCFNKHSLRDLFILGDQNAASNGGSVETTELFLEGNVENPAERVSEEGEIDEGEDGQVGRVADSAEEDEGEEAVASPSAGGSGNSDNDAILRQLFSGDQIKGVFNHDAVESDGVQNQEADLIELESTKIAESALSALRASCALVRQQRESLFTPTWTGRSGAAGDPSQRSSAVSGPGQNRFGTRVARGRPGAGVVINHSASMRGAAPAPHAASNPFAQATSSSRDMLARIKDRKNGISSSSSSVLSGAPAARSARRGRAADPAVGRPQLSSTGHMKADEIAKQLHAFLLLRSSVNSTNVRRPSSSLGATTEELLEAFGSVVSPKDKLVFRNLLRDMAVCRGRKWVLKDEFITQ